MDLVSSCKEKLSHFRIKELKDVLSQLGLVKQGKKQDLVERILGLLSDEQVSKSRGWPKTGSLGKEGVAKIIDDIYRKLQVPGATDLSTKTHIGSDLNLVKPKEETADSYQLETKIRCLCGSSLTTESMIQCEDQECCVWQHIGCAIIPEKPTEHLQPEIPGKFYCEFCRIKRADPFWLTVAHPLPPVKLTSPNPAADGTNTVQNVERTFQLTRPNRDMLQKPEYDLQVWCILLNDKVPFRMQWPQCPDLQINGVPLRPTNRPGSQLLGSNGRDDGPVITTISREGINKIIFSRCDARTFCFGVRIVKKRTVQQILNIVPAEAVGELFEEALARVRRCIGGGTAAENADSDSDLEVVADSVTVNLRCPMSGSRMKKAGRFKPCIHMGCFDLETFVELNQRSRKWQCPICLKNYSLENIIIDPYFNRITKLLQNCSEDVNEIEVKPDGSWRVKNEGDSWVLGQWHLPDGSLCFTNIDIKPDPEILKQIIDEGVSEGRTGLKLRKNPNGIWEVKKPEALTSGNLELRKLENHCQKLMPMGNGSIGSHRDGKDHSINQGSGGHFDFAANNCLELDPLDFGLTDDIDGGMPPTLSKDAGVIVLSDSEEDNVTFIPPEITYGNGTVNVPFPSVLNGVSEPFPVDPGLGASGTSPQGLFSNGDVFDMSIWQLPTSSQTTPGFPFFNADVDVPDTLVDSQHNSIVCPPINGYGLASGGGAGDPSQAQAPTYHSNAGMNGSHVDSSLAFNGDDPSLQIFLSPEPAGVPPQADLSQHADFSNGFPTDDWISLRVGGDGGNSGEPLTSNGLGSRHPFTAKESSMDSLANTADYQSNKGASKNRRSDSLFSHPRQPRSVRPRVLRIDSDSD